MPERGVEAAPGALGLARRLDGHHVGEPLEAQERHAAVGQLVPARVPHRRLVVKVPGLAAGLELVVGHVLARVEEAAVLEVGLPCVVCFRFSACWETVVSLVYLFSSTI